MEPSTRSRLGALALPTLLALPGPTTGAAGDWFSHVLVHSPVKLGGCTVGDLDAKHPGDEVVAVAADGRVYLCRGTRGHWTAETIADADGELIACAIGDADPTHEGNELVVVGMKQGGEDDGGPGVALLCWREERAWRTRELLEDVALLHAVCIVDLDESHAGPETYVAGFGGTLWQLADGGMTREAVCALDAPAKCLVAAGGGLAVACADGQLLLLRREAEGWTRTVLEDADAGQARLASAGQLLLSARDDGRLVLFDLDRPDASPEVIYSQESKLRGAVLADLDPTRPGLEAATAGYGGRMTVLYRGKSAWSPRSAFVDTAAFHHLAAGELDENGPGLELVGCGYSGTLVLVGREYRQAKLAPRADEN